MIRGVAAVVFALTAAASLPAQDTVAAYRHLLSLDLSRARPWQRTYDMVVQTADSAQVIGQREVSFAPALYAGNAVWLLVETRTGMVPAVESLFVAPDMRPVHWSSSLGAARLGAEFAGDSIFGATTTPAGRRSLLLVSRPDLLVSLAMIEALVPLLPLAPAWSDSAAVLAVDAASGALLPAELSVIAEEETRVDSVTMRPSWVVSVRAEEGSAQLWVDKESGDVLRVQQPLPSHVGRTMEYRRRATVPRQELVPPSSTRP